MKWLFNLLIISLTFILAACGQQGSGEEPETAVIYATEEKQVSNIPQNVNWQEKELVYVASMFTNEVLILDVRNNFELLGSIAVGKRPFHLLLADDAKKLFVTCALSDEALQIDTATQKVVRKISVGKRPAHMVLSGDGKTLYVSMLEEAAVAVINLDSASVIDTITVGEEPYDLLLDEERDRLFVGNFGDDSVSVVDLKKRKETERFSAGDGTAGLLLDQSGKFLYTGGHGYDSQWREIWKHDLERGKVVEIFETAEDDPMPHVLKKQPGSNLMWVLIDAGKEVYLLDMEQDELELKKIITVGKSPQEINFSPEGELALIVNTNEDSISVVDGKNFQVLGTYPAGQVPTDAVFKPGKDSDN